MEDYHNQEIQEEFPETHQSKMIICLDIPDDYDYMQPELIGILKDKIEFLFNQGLIH